MIQHQRIVADEPSQVASVDRTVDGVYFQINRTQLICQKSALCMCIVDVRFDLNIQALILPAPMLM